MELVKAENVVKKYQHTSVLKGINLTIQEGEFVGIMGKSGSGKTTLLKILGMIEPVTDGRIFYSKDDVRTISDKKAAKIRREEMGFVFQEFFLMESLNVMENVMLPLFISKNADESGREKAKTLMERFGIIELKNKMPDELSGGERQRVAICRALINEPKIVFADEPTGNLDSKSGKIVIDTLQMIHQELDKTVIMVTHDPQMASYCDRIILLKDGGILGELERKVDINDFYKEIINQVMGGMLYEPA